MEALLLDNRMFDDGSLECRTFTVCTSDSYYTCEYSHIERVFPEYIRLIEQVDKLGDHHIDIAYVGKYIDIGASSFERVFELQWD